MTAGCLLAALLLPALPLARATGQSERVHPSGVLSHYDLHAGAAWRAELPRALSEVSGLAFTPDGSLLAHGDERAVIWRFDLASRRPVARFGLGDRRGVLRGDFEDIAVAGDRIFLVTAAGEIYEGRAATDGQTGRAARRTGGLGRGCEVEGLGWDAGTRSLLLLCKTTRTRRWHDRMVILAVSVDTWRFEREPRILVDRADLKRATGEKEFHGTGLARHPRTGTWLVVAGPERTYVELSPKGDVLGGGRLDRDRHRQPEGIAVAPDLTLLISDEAAGRTATITAYAYRP
jgi:hypothetical protein